MKDVDIEERSPELILECQLNKVVSVEWYRFATQLTSITDEQHIFIEQDGLVHRLILKNIQLDDNGTYSCRYPSHNAESSCKVRVTELPLAFVQTLNENAEVTENDDLVLNVELNKVTPLKYEWLKDGVVLESDDRIKFTVIAEKYQLKLTDAKLEDQGRYTFRILDKSLETQTDVKVNELPIYFTRHLKETLNVMENTVNYQYDCEINKEKKVAQWFKDDDSQPLTNNDEVVIQVEGRVHRLVFLAVQLKHSGKYTCRFTDEIQSVGTLHVEGKIHRENFID